MDSSPISADSEQTRFDEHVRTAISGLLGDAAARVTAWRQAIDLLCQPGLNPNDTDMLIDAAVTAHGAMTMETRRAAARTAAFGSPPPALVVLLANDRPTVAADRLATLSLPHTTWKEILPQLTPVARGILRARRDLDADTRVALASFGPVDFVLSGSVDESADMSSSAGLTRIADLVARIEAYRQSRQALPPQPVPDRLAEFCFETDARAMIRWVDAPDRAALIGVSLTAVADGAGPGVDAGAMGAVRRRSAFRDARLTIASDTAAGGEWRISATPVFDDKSGRLVGYRGAARRAALHQRAEAMAAPGLSSDSLRQLVHELRTPLNAIGGFAELIERQLMGPVAAPYREAAEGIGASAQTLIEAIDDLDTAARIDGRSLVLMPEPVALGDILADTIGRYGPLLEERGVILMTEGLDQPMPVVADARAVTRLVSRVLGAVLPLATPGETLRLSLCEEDGAARIAIDRPAATETDGKNQDDPALLLGLDFSLRLIRSLARQLNGAFQADHGQLTLSLPADATRMAEDHGG
jgi:signal transduction histidine kinase